MATICTSKPESFEYKHKKFDQLKRSRDDECDSRPSSAAAVEGWPTHCRHFDDSPLTISSDSSQSAEFQGFSNNTWETTASSSSQSQPAAAIPQPPAKRRRLLSQRLEDSGIYLTPQKGAASMSSTSSPAPRTPGLLLLPRFTSTPFSMGAASPSPANLSTLSSPPTASILPRISDETLQSICKYHGNMVRKFPKKERSPKDQERRNKNTIACRMSRRVKKLEHVAIEEQYKEFTAQHLEIVEASMRAAAYLNQLMAQLSASAGGEDDGAKRGAMEGKMVWEPSMPQVGATSQPQLMAVKAPRQPKPFSIEFLTGSKC